MGAGERLEGDPLLCLLMAELDNTLKQITAGLRFSSFRGHKAFRVLEKENEMFCFFCKSLCCCLRGSRTSPVTVELRLSSVHLLNVILGTPVDGMVSCTNLEHLMRRSQHIMKYKQHMSCI